MPALSNVRKTDPLPLSDTSIAEFRDRGFTCVSDICEKSELLVLRRALERLFSLRMGVREGTYYDMVGQDPQGAPKLPTLVRPSRYAPELAELPSLQRATAIARCLLGDSAVLSFEHAILKPARHGAPTPWHQDEAYRLEAGFKYDQVSIWIPLNDATVESGCLQYIPGSNLGAVLPHRSHENNSRVYALECLAPIPAERVTPLPVRAGGCALHAGRTLHYAGPNLTDNPRYAYILEFEVPPRPLTTGREFSWHHNRQPPNRAARGRWLRRGGVVVEVIRQIRAGTLITPARVRFELRRGLSAFRRHFM